MPNINIAETDVSELTYVNVESVLTKIIEFSYNSCGHRISTDQIYIDTRNSQNNIIIMECPHCNRQYNLLFKEDRSEYQLIRGDNTYNIIRHPYSYGFEVECFLQRDRLIQMSQLSKDEHFRKLIIADNKFYFENRKQAQLGNINIDLLQDWILSFDGSLISNVTPSLSTKYGTLCTHEIKSMIYTGDNGIIALNNLMQILNPVFNSTCGLHVHVGETFSNLGETLRFILLSNIMDSFYHPMFFTRNRLNSSYCYRAFLDLRSPQSMSSIGKLVKILLEPDVDYNNLSYVNDTYYELTRLCDTASHFASTSYPTRYGTIEFRNMPGNSNIKYITKTLNEYLEIINIAKSCTTKDVMAYLRNAFAIEGMSEKAAFLHIIDNYSIPIYEGFTKKQTVLLKNKLANISAETINSFGFSSAVLP